MAKLQFFQMVDASEEPTEIHWNDTIFIQLE